LTAAEEEHLFRMWGEKKAVCTAEHKRGLEWEVWQQVWQEEEEEEDEEEEEEEEGESVDRGPGLIH
jgi:hypothetical protein